MAKYKFKNIVVRLPKCDADVEIIFPGGEKMLVQCRPSNANVNYNGSLDIILPKDNAVTNWQGDDMSSAKSVKGQPHTRIAKQLVTELPGKYD